MMEVSAEGAPVLRGTTPRVRLTRDCCRRAFLRGALLGCGTLTNPEQSYHLEFTARDEALRLSIARCLLSVGVPVKQTARRGIVSLYVKQSDHIAAVLTAGPRVYRLVGTAIVIVVFAIAAALIAMSEFSLAESPAAKASLQ